jgi:hypothetical protein
VGECSWSAQERTDSTLLPPAETSVGSRVGYKKSLSLLAETIFRCDNVSVGAIVDKFWNESYVPEEGIMAFYHKHMRHASRMV